MKPIFSTCLFCFFFFNLSYSQQIDSIFGMGTSGNNALDAIHRDQDGNIYILQSVGDEAVSFFDTTLYYNFPGSGSDMWFGKVDSNYNLQWHMPISGSNSSSFSQNLITSDANGNVYLTNFDPIFTYKFNTVGDLLWESPYGGYSIAYDESNQTLDLFNVRTPNDSIMGEEIDFAPATVITLDTSGAYANHFSVITPGFSTAWLRGKNTHGYFGVRRKPYANASDQHLEIFLCNNSGIIIKHELLNYNSTLYKTDVAYSEDLQQYFASGFFRNREPLNAPDSSFAISSNFIVQLDNDFNIMRNLRLNNSGGFGFNGSFYRLHPLGENIYLTGTVKNGYSITHLGQQHYLDAKEDNILFAKLDRTLKPKWYRLLDNEYYANTFLDFFASEEHLFFAGSSSGQNGGSNNPLPVAGGLNDVYLIKISDQDSLSRFARGRVFVDENQNGIDDNEAGFGFHQVENNITSSTQYIGPDGAFEFSVTIGENILKATSLKPYIERTTPDSIIVDVVESDSLISGLKFGVYIVPGIKDVDVSLNVLTPTRIGAEVLYDLVFKNDATDTLEGQIRLKLDPSLNYLDASILPDSILGNEVIWNYSDLYPDERRNILLSTSLDANVDLLGTLIINTVAVTPILTDTIPFNNRDTLLSFVTGSYDPNDIAVYPRCIDLNEATLPSLNYKIRFQNTGNDTAFTVFLKDTLSDLLDISSLEFKESSHPVNMQVEGNTLLFLFEDILLPDSTTNFAGSNGYVNYTIKLKPGYTLMDTIKNRAAIFFDYNPPVITNQVLTTFYNGPLVTDTVAVSSCGYYVTISGDTLSENGIYQDLFFTDAGCPYYDAIDLTIDTLNVMMSLSGNTLTADAPIGSTFQWLDCNNNFNPVPGETTQSFVALMAGSYAVEVSIDNCMDTSQCITVQIPDNRKAFPLFEDDPSWNVFSCFWLDCITNTITYSEEVAICGNTYSKVEIPNFDESGYVRSDSLKTFLRVGTDCSTKEYLMYDFSMNIGDTVFVGYNLQWNIGVPDTAAFLLQNIEVIDYQGVERRRFELGFDLENSGGTLSESMYWIEGIGSQTTPFYPMRCLSSFCENTFALMCYDSSNVQLYQNADFTSCDSTSTVGITEISNLVNIYPNPFGSKITIEMDTEKILGIEFFTIHGQSLNNFSIVKNQYLDLVFENSLEKGFYILKIQLEDGWVRKLLLKK